MFNCQQNLLSPTTQEKGILTFICKQSNNLYNAALYEVRQRFFQSSRWVSRFASIQNYEFAHSKYPIAKARGIDEIRNFMFFNSIAEARGIGVSLIDQLK